MQRVALVTGGMGGLGEAICIKLAALGYKVVTTHSPGNSKAQEWLQTMNNMGYGFKAVPCDVSDFDSCKACVEQVVKEVGPVDVLVNNAGITRDMTFKKMTKADWDAVISTNVGPRDQRLPGQRPEGRLRPDQLRRGQGRHARFHQGAGAGSGA